MSAINGDDGTPGFGIYVHWPFCAAKCPYCDFNSHVRHKPINQSDYADAFEREIAHMAARQPGKSVTSVFFGGGTPSLMEPETVDRVLKAIRGAWTVEGDIEITLEANPTSVDAARFEGYRKAGVNRVSLGVQSLDDEQLKFLGRLHSADEARKAIRLARDLFPRMSFDLIYARPSQTAEGWQRELEEAIELSADHLSLYQLTIEQGTPFYDLHKRGKLSVPDADRAADLYELTQDITEAHGLPSYEISNHAKPGYESRHNLTYWRFGTWAGIGPGAHGRLDMNDGRHALSNERNPEKWLERVSEHGHGAIADDLLEHEDVGDEYLLMGLRLKEGLDLGRYEDFAGHYLDGGRIADLIEYGMIEPMPGDRIRATPQGALVLDAVIADLAG
ncbi:radical SAM family heme chaperone HemW [Pseudahrensia aquimaris]|uniref:Heme chaperone HemW n=1 Tax=Pseudahrensia aquimaris TaxID=744461 RepID=A0ABW3FEM2_9HYPH